MADFEGEISERRQKGRLFALLWILFAAFAMQFVASAQILSSRLVAQQNSGNFSVPDNSSPETLLSRHLTRSLPAADLRFTADRGDFKGTPGGPDPFLLPTSVSLAIPAYGSIAEIGVFETAGRELASRSTQARGPPLAA